ncbi:hypothetical protein SCHPADRAFT_893737 [Schizopora paradoxa]|uniref:Uncharacterized protein n=1 Tax=Schizopora paradoxa TaxID=27342 RepID=A0A0H2R9T7_9AGAM|nr:hypothetical protein SCHPADRAFT_893737 [Schizopora paradoxa]
MSGPYMRIDSDNAVDAMTIVRSAASEDRGRYYTRRAYFPYNLFIDTMISRITTWASQDLKRQRKFQGQWEAINGAKINFVAINSREEVLYRDRFSLVVDLHVKKMGSGSSGREETFRWGGAWQGNRFIWNREPELLKRSYLQRLIRR